jgi:polar amino acid transport system substrate-binding protein
MNKRILQVVLPMLLCGALASASAAECKRIVLTGHPDYPPVLWAEGSTLRGAPILLVQKLAAETGAEVQVINPGTWDMAVTAVRTGKADAIAGIYFNDERTGFLEFVRPAWMQDPVSVIVRHDASFKFSGVADLVGRKGAAGKGESFGNDLDMYIAQNLSVSRTQGLDEALDMLITRRVDYVINGTYPALKVAIERGIKDEVAVLDPPLVTEGAYLAFSKKSPCRHLAATFGKRIEEMQRSGETEALLRAAAEAWETARK